MDKELEIIAQTTSTGDLRGKLLQAEEAKVEIEAILLKRVRMRFVNGKFKRKTWKIVLFVFVF